MVQTALSSHKEKGHITCFDLIRVFSCLCIMIVHFNATVSGWNGTFIYPNSITPNFFVDGRIYLGNIGVSLFFTLSGATLMYTYKGKILLFFRKRIRNLFPMFYIAYFVAFAYDFLCFKGMSKGNLWQWLFSLLGMDGYLATLGIVGYQYYKVGEWFLGCILLLYLIFPFYHACFVKYEIPTITATLLLYALLMKFSPPFLMVRNSILFYMRIPEIMLGMLFVKHKLYEKPVISLAIGAGIFLPAYFFRNSLDDLTLCVAFCALLFGMLSCVSRVIRDKTLQRWFNKLANLTYPIFLVHHWLSYHLVRGFSLESLPRRDRYMLFIMYLFLTLLLSRLLKYGAEKLMSCFDRFVIQFRQSNQMRRERKEA